MIAFTFGHMQPPYGAGSMHLRPIHFWLKEQALTSGKATTFFTDEWRCPVYVKVGAKGGCKWEIALQGRGEAYLSGG